MSTASGRIVRFAGFAAALCLEAFSGRAAAQPAPNISLQPYISGLTLPLGFVNAGDGSGRNFVVQQMGKILVYQGNAGLGTFLDVSALLTCDPTGTSCGEQGLLGLAFHPNYKNNGLFFIYYTDVNGDEVLARYHVSSNANVAYPASAKILFTVSDPYPNHNGGQIQFGPDGFLYIGTGDGGSGGDPENRAQNLQERLGKILRIDVNGTGAVPCEQTEPAAFGIPASNPFATTANACHEIWDYGMRNPWRFSFDRFNGDLWIGDVGQNLYEEVDFEAAGGAGGVNYGWRKMEGLHCYNPAADCDDGTLRHPILEYDHSVGCSITGGYVYRGHLYPQLFGVYLFGDYCSGTIWGLTRTSSGMVSTRALATGQFISSFGQDEAGEVYVVQHSGSVSKVVSSTSFPMPSISASIPIAAIRGDPSFQLALDGTGFTPSSLVTWNGAPLTTTYVSRTRVMVTVPSSKVSAAGSANLQALNPSPGGGTSAPLSFPINNRFLDVPLGYLLRRPIEGIAAAGLTSGCGDRIYCPEAGVTRDQVAVLLLRAEHGSSYAPPAATGLVFGDVSSTSFAASFIEELSAERVTSGCGGGNYCPVEPVTRAPMARLLLKAHDGGAYMPPAATGVFSDVPKSDPFAPWIEELARRGITSGCGGGIYCPNRVVTRAEIAAFLARGFAIPLPP